MSIVRVSMLLTVAALTTACGNKLTCDEPERYQASGPGPRIDAPDGMSELQSFKELKIPEASPQTPRPEGSPCLERPPAYQSQN